MTSCVVTCGTFGRHNCWLCSCTSATLSRQTQLTCQSTTHSTVKNTHLLGTLPVRVKCAKCVIHTHTPAGTEKAGHLPLLFKSCQMLHRIVQWLFRCTVIFDESKLNWKLKISNTADNADITQSQARNTRHRRVQEVNSLCTDSGPLWANTVLCHSTQYSLLVVCWWVCCVASWCNNN